jgi:DNA-binding NarL/FixJ family response regulator
MTTPQRAGWRPWAGPTPTVRGPDRASPLGQLTGREREGLALMAEGRSTKGICERLFLGPKTVEGHVRNIFTKLGVGEAADDHRRLLAVLSYLRSPPAGVTQRAASGRQRTRRREAAPAQELRRGCRADPEPGLGGRR